MILHYKNIIDNKLLDNLVNFIETSTKLEWKDGRLTTGGYLKKVKKNQELSFDLEINKLAVPIKNHIYNNEQFQNTFGLRLPIETSDMSIVRYKKGDEYPFHCDSIYSPNNNAINFIMSVVLNDNYKGGEMSVKNYTNVEPVSKFDLKKGDALLFAPWVLHKISPVLEGIRYCLIIRGKRFIDFQHTQIFILLHQLIEKIDHLKIDKKDRYKLKEYISGINNYCIKEFKDNR